MRHKRLAFGILLVALITIGYARIGTKVRLPGTEHHVRPPTSDEPPVETPQPAVFPATLTDATGRLVSLAAQPKRIVSLAPDLTEVLFDLGAGHEVVGDTTACDWPIAARSVPHIGGYSDMSVESVAAKNPDLIVADGTINTSIVTTLLAARLNVLVVEPKNLESSLQAIRLLGRATGRTVEAAGIINAMQSRFFAIHKLVAKAPSPRKVVVLHDAVTLYTSGPETLIDDMIRVAGGNNIATSNAPLDRESVVAAQPEVIICSPDLNSQLKAMPGWSKAVPAVENTAFFHTSDNASLIRPGLRLAAGAEELARYLHPELDFSSLGQPQSGAAAPQHR